MIPPFWRLLQTTDSLFPTGAFSHSGGLEGLCVEGILSGARDAEEAIGELLRHTVARIDLPACGLAHRAAASGDAAELARIDGWIDSLKAPREAREASASLGRRRLLAVGALPEYRRWVEEGRTPAHQAVVAGMQGAVEGNPREETMLAFCYGSAAGLVSAAMKLLPLGQRRAQELLSRLGEEAPGLVREAERAVLEELGSFLPLADIASMRHETAAPRLFIS